MGDGVARGRAGNRKEKDPDDDGKGVRPLPGALSDTVATGLILGGGALGSALLVLGLTVLAVRRGNRAEAAERRRAAVARALRDRMAAPPDHDPYPQQPYSPREPTSHQPYSRPYTLPKQGSAGVSNGHLNGHRAPENEP